MARILVVDDDRDICTVLKANLQLYGYQVDTACSATEAEARVAEVKPDLVVLDRVLPDGEGVEICGRWSKLYKGMPIIMLTARDSVSDRVVGLDSGADDYVVKPFEPLELVARIKACLRRMTPEFKEKLTLGALTVDKTSMTVTLEGKAVELTPKEYQLLCLLLDHKGEVLSRETIRKTLWKNSSLYSWSRVIDVHVQHLRQKLEKDPANPEYIKTILGTGYKFECPS